MSAATGVQPRTVWQITRGLVFPVLIACSVLVIFVPLPPWMLDVLLAANITVSIVILLTTIYVQKPLEFSVFPSLLLGTTVARLVLNVATTRLILSRGALDGTAAAGGVIEAFGEFVTAGSIAVGLIIFLIVFAIQFLVITKGATRISEVAARFALDGMPGKQMSIDADLNAGIIRPDEAKRRRAEVSEQADFYGAMDGASKYVRGDAIAGIVITLINIAGGLYIGMVENNMTLATAAVVFTKLTIGDGLVGQVPAFLISLAAGLLVTRSSIESDLSSDIVGQMVMHPQALAVSSGFLAVLAVTGLPALPLLSLSAALAILSMTTSRGKKQAAVAASVEANKPAERPQPKPEDSLAIDPMELELGYGLIRLADVSSGGDLLDRVSRVRNKIAQELGIILPKIRIRDNVRLDQRNYQIKIHDVPVAWGMAISDALLAIDTGATSGTLPGTQVREPAFGRPAVWIDHGHRERAELLGYSVVEPAAVIVTHLTEIVRSHTEELLSRQQVHQLLDNLKQNSPKIVDELIPSVLKTSQVHQVLNNLLRERVPIRNLEAILETLSNYADRIKDLGTLTEYVRHALARTICQQYRDRDRQMHVVTFDPGLEDIISAGVEFTERGMHVKLSPQVVDAINRGLGHEIERLVMQGWPPVVVVSNVAIRPAVRQITSSALPQLAVLSMMEITRDTSVSAAGSVGIDALNPNRRAEPTYAAR